MISRRAALGCLAGAPAVWGAARGNDVRVVEAEPSFAEYAFRTPLKFGGVVMERMTVLEVRVVVRDRAGRSAAGRGAMPLGNLWSFPSKHLGYAGTLEAMKRLAGRIAAIAGEGGEYGHPVELFQGLEPRYLAAARELSAELAEPIPELCTLVTASPFDLAIHDAYGKLHGASAFRLLGREYLRRDLERYLGRAFAGETLDRYVRPRPRAALPLYHLVGAVDPLTPAEVKQPVGDGLPETFAEWIPYNGLTHAKIKLNGDQREWDLKRVVAVHEVMAAAQRKRGGRQYVYSLDFNEKCPDVAYLVDFLDALEREAPEAAARLQYIEQPTRRDLAAMPRVEVGAAARRVPVVIDESLTGPESLERALELGYSGAALKACKGLSSSLLVAALAQKRKVFLCVQDLTCPGAALVASVALAAHLEPVRAIECNARQYLPAANREWESRLPGVFRVRDGMVRTAGLDSAGLLPA